MQTDRVDQSETAGPINPLDLDTRSDEHWYTPVTMSENEWNFVNDEIDDAPSSGTIPVTRTQWETFLDGFDDQEEIDDESLSEELMDDLVDETQYYYNVEDYGYTPDTYETSINALIEEEENEDFPRFLPTAISYEDYQDLLKHVDDGSDADLEPRWLKAESDSS